MDQVDHFAKIVWDYMLVHDELKPADIIICLGSHDLNVARRAAELYKQGLAPRILITGGRGKLTADDDQTESTAFAAIMYAAGVPKDVVLIEDEATNTGENVEFSHKLLNDIYLDIISAIVVTKPYMERRAKATFAAKWPELKTTVTSQQIGYEEYMVQSSIGKDQSIRVMVGDLQRLIDYAHKGWSAPQEIPAEVIAAKDYLQSAGYGLA